MIQFLFVPYLLRLLSQGTFFRKLFFYVFRAASAIAAITGLIACVGLLKVVLNLPAVGVIGGLLFLALVVVAFYAAAHIFWIRADDVRELRDAKFIMIPVFTIMVRTMGEVLASFVTVVSFGGFILFLFAPEQAGGMLGTVMPFGPMGGGFNRGGGSFVGALGTLAGGMIFAVMLLACFYLVSEFIAAIAEIAISTGATAANTALLVGHPAAAHQRVAPAPADRSATDPVSTAPICSFCGTVNPRGAAFCDNCGKPL